MSSSTKATELASTLKDGQEGSATTPGGGGRSSNKRPKIKKCDTCVSNHKKCTGGPPKCDTCKARKVPVKCTWSRYENDMEEGETRDSSQPISSPVRKRTKRKRSGEGVDSGYAADTESNAHAISDDQKAMQPNDLTFKSYKVVAEGVEPELVADPGPGNFQPLPNIPANVIIPIYVNEGRQLNAIRRGNNTYYSDSDIMAPELNTEIADVSFKVWRETYRHEVARQERMNEKSRSVNAVDVQSIQNSNIRRFIRKWNGPVSQWLIFLIEELIAEVGEENTKEAKFLFDYVWDFFLSHTAIDAQTASQGRDARIARLKPLHPRPLKEFEVEQFFFCMKCLQLAKWNEKRAERYLMRYISPNLDELRDGLDWRRMYKMGYKADSDAVEHFLRAKVAEDRLR